MWFRIKQRSFPSRNNDGRTCGQRRGLPPALPRGTELGKGYALLVVMAMAALLLVSLTVAIPSVLHEARREREEELIFRGTQYARAIALFHRQFQRFPTNLKELSRTNGIRFLRQPYANPMDPKGKWRFIHANAAGLILDSKTQPLPIQAPGASGFLPGAPPGVSPGMTQLPASVGGETSTMGTPQTALGSGGDTSSLGMAQAPAGLGAQTSLLGSQQQLPPSGPNGEIPGAFIVGVAPTSHRASIKIWKKHTHYDEWEFLGTDPSLLGSPTATQLGQPPGQPQGGFMAQPVTPATSSPPPPPAPTTPPSGPGIPSPDPPP